MSEALNISARLKAAMDAKACSQRRLCAEIGRSPTYLKPILGGKGSPTLIDAIGICDALDISLNYLAGVDQAEVATVQRDTQLRLFELSNKLTDMAKSASTSPPTLELIQSLYVRGDGRLEVFSGVSDYYDLFLPPSENDRPIVHYAGPKSLASITINRFGERNNAQFLQAGIDSINSPEFHREMLHAYSTAESQGYYSSLEKMDVPSQQGRVVAAYSRNLFTVKNHEGKRFILNFSRLLG